MESPTSADLAQSAVNEIARNINAPGRSAEQKMRTILAYTAWYSDAMCAQLLGQPLSALPVNEELGRPVDDPPVTVFVSQGVQTSESDLQPLQSSSSGSADTGSAVDTTAVVRRVQKTRPATKADHLATEASDQTDSTAAGASNKRQRLIWPRVPPPPPPPSH
jgi:hypothetical protein